jgi:hypothetical protein
VLAPSRFTLRQVHQCHELSVLLREAMEHAVEPAERSFDPFPSTP